MSKNSLKQVEISDKPNLTRRRASSSAYCLLLIAYSWLPRCGVRFDMQDQPRYKAYKKSDFFSDKRGSRNLPDGTVARGFSEG